MNSLWTTLRLRWFLATKALRYSNDFVDILYRIYLNHSKVIHVRDGYPVYSLSTPALFSKPAANFIARTLYRTIQNRNLPNLMSLAVNDSCNADCSFCSFFDGVDDATRSPLSLSQMQQVIREAQELGVSVINFVGGEPLLREDLPDIIRAVDKTFSTTVLFTNGWSLSDRVRELRQAGLDSVYVSLDASTAEKHDQRRQRDGLFDRAIAGIREAKRAGFSVGISTTLTPESYAAGTLPQMIELGKTLGVHEVLVFDALPSGRYGHRHDLVDNPDWVDDMMRIAQPYNADSRYPGVVFFAHFTSHKSVGCSCGTSYFYLSPYGDMMSCDFNHHVFGNVIEEPLWRVWERLTTTPEFCQAKWGGCKVKDGDFRQRDTISGSDRPRDSARVQSTSPHEHSVLPT
jgi:MoaA/NifB/PqqE/SkfB family radical SAM enzyme